MRPTSWSSSGISIRCIINQLVHRVQDPAPFFQWIAGIPDSKPQLIGELFTSDVIDLNYMADTGNPFTRWEGEGRAWARYRAIKLTRPSIDMAGTYHCKVSNI